MMTLARHARTGAVLVAAAALLATAAVGNASIIGYYRFEESPAGYHSSYADSTGSGPAATPTSGLEPVNTADVFGATVPQTQAGNSYSLDVTTDSAVTLGDNYRIGTGDFTFEAYVKVTGGAGSWQQMASKMTASTNTASWALLLDKSGQPMFQVRGSSASESAAATGSTSLIDSQWHHLAAVVDRTAGNIRLYVDGDLAATGAPNWAGFATEDFNGTQTASIGARNGSDSYMTGYVDEVRFSNEALDTSQFLNAIPEPGTVVLLTAGGAIAMLRRRRHQ